ncbi:hypothetical protein L2E82_06606 [Cichorium intybus]|uniref:Uncharacterized protein n=1 Tax=Cichorium intybus TaxID=13427 RepID=A0ACB9HB94_CICIN|nr:hypothetical protein L2E82_06606 [Cichorium intybus]
MKQLPLVVASHCYREIVVVFEARCVLFDSLVSMLHVRSNNWLRSAAVTKTRPILSFNLSNLSCFLRSSSLGS